MSDQRSANKGLLAIILIAAAVSGCSPRLNDEQQTYHEDSGYRFGKLTGSVNNPEIPNSDDLFIILTFSGGGSRAAALSYGVLEYLRTIKCNDPAHPTKTLLDEVDVISSVSGGSFTAAYYGLNGPATFTRYREEVLVKDIQLGLLNSLIWNPLNWIKYFSSSWGRSDFAEEYYNSEYFGGKTYGDLLNTSKLSGCRPYIILNASDMSTGSVFPFTQEQFDLLGSNLSTLPISKAVAASSAFPVLLSPIALKCYGHKLDGYIEPQWVPTSLANDQVNRRTHFAAAQAVHAYFSSPPREYVHLIDGGIIDNLGILSPWTSATFPDTLISGNSTGSLDSSLRIWKMIQNRKISKLVIINVDAERNTPSDRDASLDVPSITDVLLNITDKPLSTLSCFSLDRFKSDIIELKTRAEESRRNPIPNTEPLPDPDYYVIDVSLPSIPNIEMRTECSNMPTNFNLSVVQVDTLRAAATACLKTSLVLRKLCQDIHATQP